MIFSMTGFTTKTIEIPVHNNTKAYVTMSLKSLNSRFFEATCKLPHSLQPLEIELIKLLKDSLYRGKVTLSITVDNPLAFKGPIEPSFHVVSNYLKALEKIKEKYSIPGTITISDLLALPNIFTEEEETIDETMVKLILKNLKDLIEDLKKEQHHEGVALEKDINSRITILNTEIKAIATQAQKLSEEQKVIAQKKLHELEKSTSEVLELAKYQLFSDAERMDINEEIVRFTSHLSHLHEVLTDQNIEKGRKIDFILQELTREVNTIGAKTTNTLIGSKAISVKVELEKIREQAQNIV